MAILGAAQNGTSILGPSDAFRTLPFRGYRERGEINQYLWREEFVDALAGSFDVAYQRFIVAAARANMLDPTFTPSVSATEWLATAHDAPTSAASQDTMLDLLAFIALASYPLDQNWSVERKQAMIQVGWDLLRRKGNRIYLGAFMASATNSGSVYAVSSPPWGFSLAVTDGEPSPGFLSASSPGGWCYSATTATVLRRPWLFSAARNILEKRAFPAWSTLGLGYMQFRAGFSAAGEPIFPLDARLNLLTNEHFNVWALGVPTGWTASGVTQNTTDANRNHEFAINPATGASSCLEFDATASAAGLVHSVLQNNVNVNNQVSHKIEVDYCYRQAAAPFVSKLWYQLLDQTNSLYYSEATGTWVSTVTKNPIAPSATASTRTRFDATVSFGAASNTTFGTSVIELTVGVTSDGTASSQLSYKVYRVGLFEEWSTDDEIAAGGDRIMWLPLVDARARTTFGRAAVGVAGSVLEPANASRNSVKSLNGGSDLLFPYHAALSARGYLCNSAWTNLLTAGAAFNAGWTATNCTIATAATTSPVIGASATSASTVTPTASPASIYQTFINPTIAADQYVCGVYARKLTEDAVATVDIELIENAVSMMRRQFTLSYSAGWTLLALPACTALAGGSTLTMHIRFTGTGGAPVYGLYAAYAYAVTGKPGVLYPPVVLDNATCRPTALYHNAVATNIQDTHTRRQMITLTEGMITLTTVPMFDGTSQPDGYLFDVAQGAAQNRLSLRVTSGGLQLRLIDNGGASYAATVVLSTKDDPPVGSATWRRDEAVVIRARWDLDQGLSLSVGNGEAVTVFGSAPTVSDASLSTIHVGVNYLGNADYYDGIITNLNTLQIGPPLP